MRQSGISNCVQMTKEKPSLFSSITGKALPASIYMLVYTAYTFAFANGMNVNLIRLLYAVYYAMTAWYMLKCFSMLKTSSFLKYLNILLVLFILYGVDLYLSGTAGWKEQRENTSFLVDYIPSLLPVFVFYYFGRKGLINERWFRIFFVLFFFNILMLYLNEQRKLLETSLTDERDFISNSGYFVASLIPLIAFYDKRKLVQYILGGLILGFTIFCFKRGAILCVGLSFAYFMFTSFKSSKLSSKISILLLLSVIVYFLSGYVENLMDSSDFFYHRVMETKEGNSSGRDNIYGYFLSYFFSADNGLNILWGNGAYGTVKIYGIEAHMDWLEMAVDFGILGLTVFALFWKSVYRNIRLGKRLISPAYYMAIMMCFIFFFSRTFFSMSIGDLSFVTASIIGSGMGLIDSARRGKVL